MNLEASLEKILASDHEFGDLFYDVYFKKSPEAKDYFEGTNMRGQALMLSASLQFIGDYHKRGAVAIGQYLKILGTRHADRSIPKDMYPAWCDCLIVTLEQFLKEDWSESLADEWRGAIYSITQVMFKGYDARSGL